jgi:hypothetical protein
MEMARRMSAIGRTGRRIPRCLVDMVKLFPFDPEVRFKGASLSFRQQQRQ